MIIVTQMNPHESSERLHINSRVFGPGVGIDEDPVVSAATRY
jgi:predicted PhzF superfamily epimerase YddE/YHI9